MPVQNSDIPKLPKEPNYLKEGIRGRDLPYVYLELSLQTLVELKAIHLQLANIIALIEQDKDNTSDEFKQRTKFLATLADNASMDEYVHRLTSLLKRHASKPRSRRR